MRQIVLMLMFLLIQSTMATAKSYRFTCIFPLHVSQDTDGPSSDDPLKFEFTVDATGHGFAVGENVYPVEVITGSNGVTFLEKLMTGAVQSPLFLMEETPFKAAARLGSLVPSQYYGACQHH